MYCSRCSKQINNNISFCPYCGAPCIKGPVQPTRPPYQVNPPIPQNQNRILNQPYLQKKKSRKPIIITISVIVFIGIIGILFSLFNKSNNNFKEDAFLEQEVTPTPTPVPTPIANEVKNTQTIMIYMIGSDLESLSGMATDDIKEMIESNFNTDSTNVILMTGGTNTWQAYNIPNNTCMIYQVSNSGLKELNNPGLLNMGQSNTLTSFIEYCFSNYSTDKYSLILWDHGGGSMLGYGVDELNQNDGLTLTEIKEALSDCISSDKKLEWIGFDACLMSTIELCFTLKDYCNYMIASEEVEPGYGWNYASLHDISNLDSMDGGAIGTIIIDDYFEFYENNFLSVPDLTLSCLDLSKADLITPSLNDFINELDELLVDGHYSDIAKRRFNTKGFGINGERSLYDTIDLYDLVLNSTDMCSSSSPLLTDLESLVYYNKSNVDNAYGVTIYFPFDNQQYAPEWVNYYDSLNISQDYSSFLKRFTETLTGDALADWDMDGTTPIQDSLDLSQYYVQLPEELHKNLASVRYSLWGKADTDSEDDNYYNGWISGLDVNVSDDGKVTSNFDGKTFYMNHKSQKIQVTAMQIEQTNTYKKYVVFAYLWGANIKGINIYIRVDDEHPNGVIIGACENTDTDDLQPASKLFDLEMGTTISFDLFAYNPFDSSAETISGFSESITIEEPLTSSIEPVIPDGTYFYRFDFKDTQGNVFHSEPIYIKY